MKLSTQLPKKALEDLTQELINNPKKKHAVMGIIDTLLLTANTDTGTVEPAIRFLELKVDKDRALPAQQEFDFDATNDNSNSTDIVVAELLPWEAPTESEQTDTGDIVDLETADDGDSDA